MCVGRSTPGGRGGGGRGGRAAPRPEPTARRVVTSTDRTSYRRRPDDPSRRRGSRIGSLRRLGTKSLQIPLLNVSDLNNPL